MTFIENLILIFGNYPILISFLSGLFGGEELIITLSFLSANGFMPILVVLIFSTLGVFLSDITMYSVGRFEVVSNFKNSKKISKTYEKIDYVIIKLSKGSLFRTLLYSKFFYGTRALTLIYLGMKKSEFKKFLIYDFVVVVILSSIVVAFGWFGGSSFRIALEIFKNVQLGIFFIVIFVIILYLIKKWVEQKLILWQNR